jgi:hypothetical protein
MFLRFFYDFSTIIPLAHFPPFPREILVSRSKENPSPNLACTKFFYNSSLKSLWNLCFLTRVNSQRGRIVELFGGPSLVGLRVGKELWKNCKKISRALVQKYFYNPSTILPRRAARQGFRKNYCFLKRLFYTKKQ